MANSAQRRRRMRAVAAIGIALVGLVLAFALSTCQATTEDTTGQPGTSSGSALVWDQGNWDSSTWQ